MKKIKKSLKEINKKTVLAMSDREIAALSAYWAMGSERSLIRLHQEWSDVVPNHIRPRSITTLKNWSRKYGWVEKIDEMNKQANNKIFEDAVNSAHEARVDIMKLLRAVVARFAMQMKNQPQKEITAQDVKTFWEMTLTEMGIPTKHTKSTHDIDGTLAEILKEEIEDENK